VNHRFFVIPTGAGANATAAWKNLSFALGTQGKSTPEKKTKGSER
jgi:hypothetical protein